MAKDYYDVLGVSRDATGQDIKKAFRQIARECHPDVSGDDPEAEQRFKKARVAYETLMDPVTRARYDRRGQRRSALGKGGSFFEDFYRRTGESQAGARPTRGRPKKNDPRNNMGLDDLFNVGDFGFGSNVKSDRTNAGGAPPPRRETKGVPQTGADVLIEIEVPAQVAARGGSVTAVYRRMQRSDSWRPGSGDPGLVEVEDIADIRIIPNTRNGMTLRERGLGSAGPFGGSYGDLIARVKLVAGRPSSPPPPRAAPEPQTERIRTERIKPEPDLRSTTTPPPTGDEEVTLLEIGVVEALLGGRVALDTPQGRVRLTIPPGTSSGTRLRLKGKGSAGRDLYVEIRIMVPRSLDEESRKLIEEFARLNP